MGFAVPVKMKDLDDLLRPIVRRLCNTHPLPMGGVTQLCESALYRGAVELPVAAKAMQMNLFAASYVGGRGDIVHFSLRPLSQYREVVDTDVLWQEPTMWAVLPDRYITASDGRMFAIDDGPFKDALVAWHAAASTTERIVNQQVEVIRRLNRHVKDVAVFAREVPELAPFLPTTSFSRATGTSRKRMLSGVTDKHLADLAALLAAALMIPETVTRDAGPGIHTGE